MASKSAPPPQTTNDLSSFLRTSFAARPPASQKPVIESAADVQMQAFLDCHHDDYKMRKRKNKQSMQDMRAPAVASASPVAPAPLKPSLDSVLKMMSARASGAASPPTTVAATSSQKSASSPSSSSPAQPIRKLQDGQKLNLYNPY